MSERSLNDMSQDEVLALLQQSNGRLQEYVVEIKSALEAGKPQVELAEALERLSGFMVNQSNLISFLRGEVVRCAKIWCGCGAMFEFCGVNNNNNPPS